MTCFLILAGSILAFWLAGRVAREYGVSQNTVSRIVSGLSWQNARGTHEN